MVRNTKSEGKPYKLSDGEGLFLLIHPSSAKYRRFRYFFAGKEKLLAIGVYPQISLGNARQKRAEARSAIAQGIDPGEIKKQEKQ